MIRLHLVHITSRTRRALTRSLRPSTDLRLSGFSRTVDDALTVLRSQPCDMVLIGASQPTRAQRSLLRIRSELPELRRMVLEVPGVEEAVTLLESGAAGYVLDGTEDGEMVASLRAAAAGNPRCSPEVAAVLFRRLKALAARRDARQPESGGQKSLTRREKEVLQLIAAGLRNKEIARQLQVSVSTVKNHVHKILDKLKVDQRRGAIRQAYEMGLLDGPTPWSSSVSED